MIQKISVKDIIEKNNQKKSGFSGFIKKFIIALLIIALVCGLAFVGYYFYREYKIKQSVEEMIQEKADEIVTQQQQQQTQETDNSLDNQENQDSQDNNGETNIFDYDIDEIFQNFNIDQIEEYLMNNEEFQSSMTEQEKQELLQMIEELKKIYNVTGVFSPGN